MGFWNGILLFGLAAVAIPVIIHLLNRRRAQVIDWGAMRFLLGSVAARNRRIMIEEIILMILRCLLVGLVALAVARPFFRERSIIPWGLVLPVLLGAVICVAVAGAAWHQREVRRYALALALVLLLLAGMACGAEYLFQGKLLPSETGGRDIGIVIDGSLSMCLRPGGGESNFERAVTEAGEIISSCDPRDTISLLVAGPVPKELTHGPSVDKKQVDALLRKARPVGGSIRIMRAIETAANVLQEGHNPAKRIVLLTDGQDLGWEMAGRESWQGLATGLKKTQPGMSDEIICRRLPLPSKVTNAAIEEIAFSHKVIGVERAVRINVTVRNFGANPVPASSLELHIEGKDGPLTEAVKEIAPGASQSASFEYRFEKPGPHVVTASFLASDDLMEDNTAVRVVNVVERLPVLIVDGAPAPSLDDSSSGFLAIALSLKEDLFNKSAGAQPAGAKKPLKSTIEPIVILPEELAGQKDLNVYRTIVLANVARLPDSSAKMIAQYVSAGGGLLILAGDRTNGDFYNGWSNQTGEPVCPAKLPEKRKISPESIAMSLKSFTHPGIRSLIDAGESDAGLVTVSAYWPIEGSGKENLAHRASLENGCPLIVERRVGKGMVVMTSVGFNGRDSNLPISNFFLPFAHELVYYLAETAAANLNVKPGMEVLLPQASGASKSEGEEIKVVHINRDKAGNEIADEVSLPVVVELDEKTQKVTKLVFKRTEEPGLFRFLLPKQMAEALAGTPARNKGLPFAVETDAAEGDLTQVKPADIDQIARYFNDAGVGFHNAASADELKNAIAGVPNREIWKYLAIGALIVLIGEIALARWIAVERKVHAMQPVTFGASVEGTLSFRAKAREMVAVPGGKAK